MSARTVIGPSILVVVIFLGGLLYWRQNEQCTKADEAFAVRFVSKKQISRSIPRSKCTNLKCTNPKAVRTNSPLEEDEDDLAADQFVEEFDELTDRWRLEKGKAVSDEDVTEFVQTFKNIPTFRRKECLHRMLNLLPDRHIALVKGILFDRSMPLEYRQAIFSDVLNRGEDVKRQTIIDILNKKDNDFMSDAQWIFEVTGETTKK